MKHEGRLWLSWEGICLLQKVTGASFSDLRRWLENTKMSCQRRRRNAKSLSLYAAEAKVPKGTTYLVNLKRDPAPLLWEPVSSSIPGFSQRASGHTLLGLNADAERQQMKGAVGRRGSYLPESYAAHPNTINM